MRPLPDGGFVHTSSAIPESLIVYGRVATELDDRLTAGSRRARDAFDRFMAGGPDLPACIPDPTPPVTDYATRNGDVDAWVSRVGSAFVRADGRGFFCTLDPHVVTVDDDALATVGWPTREEATAAGRALAEVVRSTSPGEVDADTLRWWGAQLDRHRQDTGFTAAFFQALGVDGTVAIPQLVENAWPADRLGHPEWGLPLLRPFSEALATALRSADASYRDALADYVPGYGASSPEEYQFGLLFTAGAFPTDFLLRLADNVVVPPLVNGRFAWPLHPTSWGPAVDPVVNVLGALSRNAEASSRFVRQEAWTGPTDLELLLGRWSADLDLDGGRAAAEVVHQALTSADAQDAERVFDDALTIVGRDGSVRNPFLADAMTDATVLHIGHLQTLAATEGDDMPPRIVGLERGLALLFADDGSARRIYDAAVRQVYDSVAGSNPGSDLSDEAWRSGSLLGLVMTADAHAKEVSAEQRVARRRALLDGLTEITDLGLTFTSGKWIPFAAAGRDAVLAHFRNDAELDQALTDVHEFDARVRYQLSVVIAVRLAAEGRLHPPFPLTPLAQMTGVERARFDAWLNSSPVREAITPARTVAGERMDELENLLQMPG